MSNSGSNILITGISSPSGGGKTTIAQRTSELLGNAAVISFDEYDHDTVHPETFRKWLEEGANYNDWKTPRLREDLSKLKAGKSIVSPVDGVTIKPTEHIIFDSPLGYAHHETAGFIDFMVFIDTPLDIAMARRLLRDYALIPPDSAGGAIDSLKVGLTAYLDYGRQAYLEMDKQIKSTCNLVLDGRSSVDALAQEIVEAIAADTA